MVVYQGPTHKKKGKKYFFSSKSVY